MNCAHFSLHVPNLASIWPVPCTNYLWVIVQDAVWSVLIEIGLGRSEQKVVVCRGLLLQAWSCHISAMSALHCVTATRCTILEPGGMSVQGFQWDVLGL